jgi:ribose/xylose/arabinose/galactoside ABC-type transport system permease subunit
LFDEIESYAKTNYYVQSYVDKWSLREFFGNSEAKEYTKLEIYAPSKYFKEDLWFSEGAPAKVSYASGIYYAISEHTLISAILLILVISAAAGAVAGLIVFREIKKYALVGLANIFTIIGLAIAVAFTKTKRIDEIFRRRLRQEGFMVISADRRKFVFIVLFSILFLVISLIVGYVLKMPLMF